MIKPRRARACWLKGAPSYLYACYDHKKGLERYTFMLGGPEFWEPSMGQRRPFLGTCHNGLSVSMFGELEGSPRFHSRHRIKWEDVPKELQEHVIRRCT